MTVSELIEKLKLLPQDARVIVSGYEGGLTELDPVSPKLALVHLNVEQSDYCGEHERCDQEEYYFKNIPTPEWLECYKCENKSDRTEVVVIER